MGKPHPYRRREPVSRPPRPPAGATLDELAAWQREVMAPWAARLQERDAGRAITPRASGAERRSDEMRGELRGWWADIRARRHQ